MKNKERILWISSLAIILAVSIFFILQYQSSLSSLKQEMANLSNDNAKLQQQKGEYLSKIEELQEEVEGINEKTKTQHSFDEAAIPQLKAKGFNGQLDDIVSDLNTHRELIPHEGILGGTMDFHGKDSMVVLTDKWVLAYFSDGHIDGYMLLEYKINNNDISWKVVDSYING